jgi:hypothetical protein
MKTRLLNYLVPCKPVSARLLFGRLIDDFCDHVWSCGSCPGLADRLIPGVGDSGRRHERTPGNHSIVAPLRAEGISRSRTPAGQTLRQVAHVIQFIAEGGQAGREVKPRSDFLPAIDWFWVKIGIKAGLAATTAILLLMWINPPGPGSIPLVAFFLIVLGRPFLRAGGTGDLRSFQNSFLAALGSAGCAGLLILTTPFLANYFVMNLALFLILFVFGFLTARRVGVTFWMQIGMLAIFIFVGLNPQQPVATQTIIDAYVGFIVGMGIATVVGRLIWPVLPQMVMRDNLLALFANKVFSRENYLRASSWKQLSACSS